MKKPHIAHLAFVLIPMILLAAGSAVMAQVQSKPEAALKAAMDKEIVQGDLKGAIEQYKKLAQSSDRALAAKALIQMAGCYQKLGDAEAQKIYEQVVKNFADQKEAVALARSRLGVRVPNSGVISRQVWTGPKADAYGRVSPDGRLLSFTDWETGDLAIHDLTTGQDRRLTNKGSWNDSVEEALMSTISRDGRQVAYAWYLNDSGYELRVINVNGGQPRVLVPSKSGVDFLPLDWSPDGKWLAVFVHREDDTGDVGLVATTDGAVRILKSGGRAHHPLSRMSFSPDGKYLAYDIEAKENPDKHEIHLLAVDGGQDVSISSQPANDRVLAWSPDGKLIFASDRTGVSAIWAQAINDGKAQGTPALIKTNVNPYSLGLTRSGALYYSIVSSVTDIYVASVDFETGKVLSGPSPLAQPYFGISALPQWSRDGKYLAYLSRRDPISLNNQMNILTIRSMDTGKVRELNPNMRMLNVGNLPFPLWLPDGSSVVVNAVDKQDRAGVYRIDTQTGTATPVVQKTPGDLRITTRALSPDGRTLYIEKIDAKSKTSGLFAHDLQSGEEREIIRRDGFALAALSLDGRTLVTVGRDNGKQSSALLVVPVEGGTPRELLRTSNSGSETLGAFVTWSPDGRFVIFRKGPADARETFRMPAEGGTAVKYGAEWTVGLPSISPNGRDVALQMGQHTIEVWALENFLPNATTRK